MMMIEEREKVKKTCLMRYFNDDEERKRKDKFPLAALNILSNLFSQSANLYYVKA